MNSTADPRLGQSRAVRLHGQPGLLLELPNGDRAEIALQGAHVLRWRAREREQLYLSPTNPWDGQHPIRGGVPVCWPQFSDRGPLPKHGFVRQMPWVPAVPQCEPDSVIQRLVLRDNEASRALWPHGFTLTLTVQLLPESLRMELMVQNTSTQSWSFTGALHTYFAVDDIAQVLVEGLGGQPEWDALQDAQGVAAEPLRLPGHWDRVYDAPRNALELVDGAHRLRITQSDSLANQVVWNPGPRLCAELPDMPDDDHRRMLCVEAAQVFKPITVAPGAHWRGDQTLQVI
jgi:glucose-6-phosphate 1-epimerase